MRELSEDEREDYRQQEMERRAERDERRRAIRCSECYQTGTHHTRCPNRDDSPTRRTGR